MSYVDELERELRRAGITGRRQRRILAEFSDHLHSDADANLGDPAQIARQFADELGTSLAREAAFRAFAALACCGIGLLAMALVAGRVRTFAAYGRDLPSGTSWVTPSLLLTALAAQVALASGGLALLRAWQLRGVRVISTVDAAVLTRRAAIGVLSGAITMASLPVLAEGFPQGAGSSWDSAAWVVAALAMVLLACTVPGLLASARIRPTLEGTGGDLRDDLAPLVPRSLTPVVMALILSAAIVVLLTLAGIVTDDPYDGALRGLLDGAACMAGFFVLGRFLGLRPAAG